MEGINSHGSKQVVRPRDPIFFFCSSHFRLHAWAPWNGLFLSDAHTYYYYFWTFIKIRELARQQFHLLLFIILQSFPHYVALLRFVALMPLSDLRSRFNKTFFCRPLLRTFQVLNQALGFFFFFVWTMQICDYKDASFSLCSTHLPSSGWHITTGEFDL